MKTIADIVAQRQQETADHQNLEKKKAFESGLFTGLKVAFAEMLGTALKLVKKSTYSVKVENQIKLPAVQQVEGTVSLKEIRTLVLGLNEVVKELKTLTSTGSANTTLLSKELKPTKVDFTALEKAVKAIKIPETVVPDYPTVMQISNLEELKKPLENLATKFKVEAPVINIPPAPKTITVGNLEGLQTTLESILAKEEPTEEPLIGLSWKKDDNGNLQTLTEIYPSGTVVSTGWGIGSVKIDDQRK